jgi:GNAT superfamily N-acetyltransferase
VKIAPYRDPDFAAVVALWDACGISNPQNDPARDIPFARDAANAMLFVGHRDGRLIGTVLAGHDGHRGWLYKLAVAPDQQGNGFGRALVRHAEDWIAACGLPKVNLMIRDTNLAVRDFYAKLGYAEQPRTVMGKWFDAAGASGGRPLAKRTLDLVVTFLEMTEPPQRPAVPAPPGKLALLRAEDPPVAYYRFLYDTVGEPWFWIDRRLLDDEALGAIIGDPQVEIYVLYEAGVPAGFVELDRRAAPDVAIAYFGLLPGFIGRRFGPYLLDWAIRKAWSYQPRRLTVDTCTLDHPKALILYQRAGFVPYKQVAKTIDDPRLTGLIPPHREPRRP